MDAEWCELMSWLVVIVGWAWVINVVLSCVIDGHSIEGSCRVKEGKIKEDGE